jgi:hypothetical protein
MSLMPCFNADQGQAEGIIIGRLLAGYGELELELCACRIAVEGILDIPIRELFGERGEKKRLRTATAALRSDYTRAGLITDVTQALDDLDWCRQIRNQYAHCHWYWTSAEGLCFVNLEELATQLTHILALTNGRHPVSLALLEAQEAFFWYVKQCLMHLGDAYRAWDSQQGTADVTPPVPFIYPKPQAVARPPAHG